MFKININNEQLGILSFSQGEKWSDVEKNVKSNKNLASIFAAADINKNGIVDKEDVIMLKKILNIANNLIPEKAGDNVIDDDEITRLKEQIEQKKINLEDLKREALAEANSDSGEADTLFNLINTKNRHAISAKDLYEDLYKEYTVAQEKVTEYVEKKYGNIMSILTSDERKGFIKKLSIKLMCGEKNISIAELLPESTVNNENMSRWFNNNIPVFDEVKYPLKDMMALLDQTKNILKVSKDEDIRDEFETLLTLIADNYNKNITQ